jgi:uncharacterized damage-inducible protein DinB
MTIADSLLPQFDHEMATTRKVLACVPEAKAAWKPHLKSMSLGELAAHLGMIAAWAVPTLRQPALDFASAEGGRFAPPPFTTTAALLALHDANAKAARAAIAATGDADFLVPWTLRSGATEIFTMPRIAVMRGFVISHGIHHRGQLTVYLRLLDVPLPAVYGPSADAII